MNATNGDATEASITQWRAAVLRSPALTEADADELESHLREQLSDLVASGLSGEEAFLIAVRRLGQTDAITAEYAREHGDRLWKQLVVTEPSSGGGRFVTMLVFAVAAAVVIQVGRVAASWNADSEIQLFGAPTEPWFLLNVGFFVLPLLAAYFAVTRGAGRKRWLTLLGVTVVLALVVNLFPLVASGSSQGLVALHLPVLLWFLVGATYVHDLRSPSARMDFIRFTGEWAIYYVLIALGGAVLLAITARILTPIAPDSLDEIVVWVLPSGAAAAVIVAAWLVEAKKSIIENLAPVLTAIFTPLFAVMLVAAAVAYAAVGLGEDFDRDLLTVFDGLLIIVLALVVYGISARDPDRTSRVMDVIRLVAVAAAILLDLLVLVSMFDRIGEFGFTANRVAALGLNLILLVNLIGTAVLTTLLLAGRALPTRLERWQTDYLPVFALWAAAVVLAIPPAFGFQ